ncbi:MAG: Zinc-transporting ATPase [Chlamydiia bacterium]|nr:Zinc-transporting ATPase [Chlamydiia bacterium]MCH9616122.1 Zinc-transporting ATPase [Chlamydiia bacterium]MCH9629455.1 Zinc-transporting ATPase [Chlamydiia bacterium]
MAYVFDEFFTSGLDETISPFLKPRSARFAKNLSLKSSLISGFFLLLAFILSFYNSSLSNLSLIFVFFLSGVPALLGTIEDIKDLEINIDILMTLAAFLSVLIGAQIEGALLLVLFDFSGAMEDTVTRKASSALTNLNKITPTLANVLCDDGHVIEKSVREIHAGVHIIVKAGEVAPLDGKVIDGHSFVNLVHLTGESVPLSKQTGDEIAAGSRNLDGTLTLEVTRTSSESTLAKIIQLINEAQEMKPKFQRFLDRFSQVYATSIIGLATLFGITLPWIFNIGYLGVEGSIYRALAFLIAASPCALIIATPTAYLSAISACAKRGILLKGGITLDGLASCKTLAFDKTGTLTTGQLTCTSFETLQDGIGEETAIALAAGLERHATHPMATAITRYAKSRGISPAPISDFRSVPGFGLQGTYQDKEVKIGNAAFVQERLKSSHKMGQLITFMEIGSSLYAFHFQDQLRPEAKGLLKSLKEQFKLVMLTGDHKENASSVAKSLDIDNYECNLTPEDKLKAVSKLSSETELAMIGDGINDAPALARSTIGISMGKIGSGAAIDASDIVFLHDQIGMLDWLVHKSTKTTAIVKENISLALAVICLATIPALLGLIPLGVAVVLHEGGTVIVGLNSLRLLKK